MTNELFKRIIEGDEKAFEQVFKTHFKSMCFNARLLGLSHEESKEVAQQTFYKLWEIRETLKPQGPLENYLYKSLQNNCFDFLRSRKRRFNHLSDKFSEGYFSDIHDDYIHEKIEYNDIERKFRQALEQFPTQMKEVFVMSRIEGLKYKEIADKMGISVKTVETQVSRALSRLREELKDYLPFLLFMFIK
jgi:RNA polymerase sigma-70 factor, ECF subfamily